MPVLYITKTLSTVGGGFYYAVTTPEGVTHTTDLLRAPSGKVVRDQLDALAVRLSTPDKPYYHVRGKITTTKPIL